MNRLGKAALAAGLTAMVATTPLPALAAYGSREVAAQRQAASPYDDASDYHRRRWRNRRLDVDAGDVILGIGLIAAIAAVADAGNKNRRSEPRRDDEPRYRDYDQTPAPSYNGGDDVGSAVSACTDAAERASKGRVDEIGSVTRESNGWRVEGEIGNDGFTCTVNNGRVEDIRIGDREI